VLIRSCHGAGKTFFAAALVLWWIFTRHNSRTLTLAQTWSGVEGLLWPEIEKLYTQSVFAHLRWGKLTETKLDLGKTYYAIGASTDRPAHLEGHHSDTGAMRVVDEAKEVDKGIFTSTEGMLDAPENLDLWISTPSIQDGEFYERDTSGDESVIRVVVDVDELIDDGIPGKAEWKAARAKPSPDGWGVNSDEFQSRAMARYIANSEGALFPVTWIERAMEQTFEVAGPLSAGMDVAGSIDGDQNAVAIKAGPETVPANEETGVEAYEREQVRSIDSWHERDTMVSKGRALSIARPLDAKPLRVDVIGLGKGVADAARQDGYDVEEYRAAGAAHDKDFVNAKAEDAWSLRAKLERNNDAIEAGRPGTFRLPNIALLKKQARGMKYKILPSGKKQVIDPKPSPDLIDAVIIVCSPSRTSGIFDFYARHADKKTEAA